MPSSTGVGGTENFDIRNCLIRLCLEAQVISTQYTGGHSLVIRWVILILELCAMRKGNGVVSMGLCSSVLKIRNNHKIKSEYHQIHIPRVDIKFHNLLQQHNFIKCRFHTNFHENRVIIHRQPQWYSTPQLVFSSVWVKSWRLISFYKLTWSAVNQHLMLQFTCTCGIWNDDMWSSHWNSARGLQKIHTRRYTFNSFIKLE